MSFAFLPLYTGDYRRDTQHLTPLKHGIYLLLLFHCWDTRGPLPLDEQEQAGIANCRSADEIEALRYVVRRFFVCMEDGHYNRRMQLEIERAAAISGARSEAGRKGYEAKAKAIARQVLGKCLASDSTPTTTTTLTPTTTTTTTKVNTVAHFARSDGPKSTTKPPNPNHGTRLPLDWRLPDDWLDLAIALRPDWTRSGVVRESITFRDYWWAKAGKDAVKMSWLATWRNWIRRAEKEPAR